MGMHDTVTDPKFNFYFGGCFQQHWKLSIPASYATSEAICFFMMIALIDRQPATVLYFRHIGPYGKPILRFWREIYAPWAVMNKLGADHSRFGINHDNPSVTEPRQCRYDACIEVAPESLATGGALKSTIPGGKYAVVQFRGTVEQLGEAWAALLRDWLPSSGLQLDSRPSFEHYPKGTTYDCETGEIECEICIPVCHFEKQGVFGSPQF